MILFNNSKTRDPIAVWYLTEGIDKQSSGNVPPPQEITLGWDAFKNKLEQEDIHRIDINDIRWQESPPDESHFYTDVRQNIVIGKYTIIDGNNSLRVKLNSDPMIKLSNIQVSLFDNNISTIGKFKFDKNSSLFFNANPKFRNNILAGKQPLRSSKYYREKTDHSGDSLEGVISMRNISTEKAKNITFLECANESYIISLHDKPVGVSKFGSDLFEINDIGEWLQAVYLQVDSYWLSNEDYVGCIVCLDKVNYSGGKILETNSIEIDTYLKKYFGFSLGLVQLKGENIQFIIYLKQMIFTDLLSVACYQNLVCTAMNQR